MSTMTEQKIDSESDGSRVYSWSPSTSSFEEEVRTQSCLSDIIPHNSRYFLVENAKPR